MVTSMVLRLLVAQLDFVVLFAGLQERAREVFKIK